MTGLYIPEMLTPLFYTPWYEKLSPGERLSYNRLHGRYFLEQTIFFEQVMGKALLGQLLRLAPNDALAGEVRDFAREEDQHSAWFRALLREEDPAGYAHTDFVLLGASPWLRRAMNWSARAVRWAPGLLWLQLMCEERSLYFGKCFVAHAPAIEPRFLEVHKKHLAEEISHIRRDELFLNWLWPACGDLKRGLNARLLRWMLKEFFYLPKRSGWRVVEVWLGQNPRWQEHQRGFYLSMHALGKNAAFIHSLYPKKHLPRTLALSKPWPELAFFGELFTEEPA